MSGFLLILGSYLLGSISSSYLLVRSLLGQDIRTLGSGNPGATNTLRVAGRLAASGVLLMDVLKGALPVVFGRWQGLDESFVSMAALAAVVGHVFPLYFGFHGGKGVATAAGACGVLAPLPLLASLVLFCALLAWKRYVSLASIVGVGCYPLFLTASRQLNAGSGVSAWPVISAVSMAVVIIFRHRSNLRRLNSGVEPRLGEGSG